MPEAAEIASHHIRVGLRLLLGTSGVWILKYIQHTSNYLNGNAASSLSSPRID